MKFHVRNIEAAAKELRYEEPTADLTPRLDSPAHDFQLPPTLTVNVTYYSAGPDLFFQGGVDGDVVGRCSCCLEEYRFPLEMTFRIMFSPHSALSEEREIEEDDVDLSYYDGEEIDLSLPLHEQILLSLPTRPLCRDDCAGLCSHCGANRNVIPCDCHEERGDPRLAVLRTLKMHS